MRIPLRTFVPRLLDGACIPVTYALNHWDTLNSRTPSFRFGTGHIYNNYFVNNNDGINTRDGAQLLVEGNVWSGGSDPLYATDEGFAVARDNDFGGGENTAPEGAWWRETMSLFMLIFTFIQAPSPTPRTSTLCSRRRMSLRRSPPMLARLWISK